MTFNCWATQLLGAPTLLEDSQRYIPESALDTLFNFCSKEAETHIRGEAKRTTIVCIFVYVHLYVPVCMQAFMSLCVCPHACGMMSACLVFVLCVCTPMHLHSPVCPCVCPRCRKCLSRRSGPCCLCTSGRWQEAH